MGIFYENDVPILYRSQPFSKVAKIPMTRWYIAKYVIVYYRSSDDFNLKIAFSKSNVGIEQQFVYLIPKGKVFTKIRFPRGVTFNDGYVEVEGVITSFFELSMIELEGDTIVIGHKR